MNDCTIPFDPQVWPWNGTTNPVHSGQGSIANEVAIYIPQISGTIRCSLVSYSEHSFEGLQSLLKCSLHILQPQPTKRLHCWGSVIEQTWTDVLIVFKGWIWKVFATYTECPLLLSLNHFKIYCFVLFFLFS